MFITRLNRLFEKHGKVAFIVMFFVIVLPFVGFIGSASLLDALRGKSGRGGVPTHVATVAGKKLQESDLRLHLVAASIRADAMRMYRQTSVAEIRQSAIDRLLMLREAKNLGLAGVTDVELKKSIQANPMAQDKDGNFNNQALRDFLKMLEMQYKISPNDYDTIARDDIVLGRLMNNCLSAAEKTVGTDDAAIRKDYVENRTKFDCMVRRFVGSDYEKQAETEYLARVAKPEDRLAEAKKYYDTIVEPMRADVETQLAANRGNDAFREAFQNVRLQLTSDIKLKDADVEKQVGDYADKLTKVIPFFVRERKMVMSVSFPLADYPAVVTPEEIAKEFAAGKDRYKDKKLEEVSVDIQKALARQKSLEAAGKAAADFKDAVYAAARDMKDGQTVQMVFESVAKEKTLKVQKSDWFDDSTSAPLAGIDAAVVAKSYAEVNDMKPLGNMIEGRDACHIACWVATKPAFLPKFDVAAADIQEKVLKVKAAEEAPKLARKDAEAVVAALKDAPLVEADLIAKFKLEKETLTREADYNNILPGFKKMTPGEVSGPIETPASMYMPASVMVAKLLAVTLPTDEEFTKAKAEYRQTMINNEYSKKLNELRERLRKENQVEFNRHAADRR